MAVILDLIDLVFIFLILIEIVVSWPVEDSFGRVKPSVRSANPPAYRVYMALLPFTWAMMVYVAAYAFYLHESGMSVFFGVIYTLLAVWWYYKWKNNRDDRWKKRRAKLASQVKVATSGKLIVQPVKSGA